MPVLDVEKALRSLRKDPVILKALLHPVTEDQARSATDGPDGWSVTFIVCHLRDFEAVFIARTRQMLDEEFPHLPRIDHEALVLTNDYASQSYQHALSDWIARRQAYLDLLAGLDESQWLRRGVHPYFGEGTVLDFAINTALHDINHMEQIVRALGTAEAIA